MITMILKNRMYDVIQAVNGQEAVEMVENHAPDLVLLDVMMPVMDGFTACEKIREISSSKIIMLTAKGEDYDQVKGLTLGADDYVVKPFTPMVLVARIEAVLRRVEASNHKRTKSDVLVLGLIEMNTAAHTVKIDGQSVELKRKEFELLVYLLKNRGISLSREQILEKVWGYDYLGSDSTVDTHINRLRNKLGTCSTYLKTVRGYGYKMEDSNEI
jgi:DNA-binding response OmpR family regulator